MPRLTRKIPTYRLHKARNLAVVTLDGMNHYLGPFGSPESRRAYDRLVGEWLAASRHSAPNQDDDSLASPTTSVDELILRYWDFAKGYYLHDGHPARELDNIKDALRPLRKAYGSTPAASFGPVALKAVRLAMIHAGLARNTVNARVGRIRRMFKWAVAEELVPPTVLQGLQAVVGLRSGRGGVKETAPVRPASPEQVAAVLPFVSRPVAAMIRLQDLTAMRPGEVMSMRTADLDRSAEVWVYRPARHKTQDRGFSRAISVGPKAQAVLVEWLNEPDPLAYLFSPARAVAMRNAEARRKRRSPMTPSQAARKPKDRPKRRPRDRYDKRTYHTAIERACDRAFPHPALSAIEPEALSEPQRAELLAWRKSHRWASNRLRHAAATRIRKAFDLEAAQVVLGHAKADVTQIYAERDLKRAVEVMREIG